MLDDKELRAKNIRAGIAYSLIIVASLLMTVLWAIQYSSL